MDVGALMNAFLTWSLSMIAVWGYFGVFFVSLIAMASIIFPTPSYVFVFASGGILNPWLVGISAGAGSAIGELVGYGFGYGGRHVIKRRYRKLLKRTKKWVDRHGLFAVIFLFAATPLPDDIVGIIAGVVNYDIRKFLLASFLGKTLLNLIVAWAGFYSISWVMEFLGTSL